MPESILRRERKSRLWVGVRVDAPVQSCQPLASRRVIEAARSAVCTGGPYSNLRGGPDFTRETIFVFMAH